MEGKLRKGQVIFIDNTRYVVVNMVEYQESSWIWQEYEIKNEFNQHKWLCVEVNEYGQTEYSIYVPYYGYVNTNEISFFLDGREYRLYERGIATVIDYFGNADVDMHERCNFIDYATNDESCILSVEYWGAEVEKSIGEYIDNSRVVITGEVDVYSVGPEGIAAGKGNKLILLVGAIFLLPMIFSFIIPMVSGMFVNKSIQKYLGEQSSYTYVTSVTNNTNNKKAKVYKSPYTTIDETVKNIIDGVPEGITDTIDSDLTTEEDGIGLHTSNEFAYVYLEDAAVYVQVSDKEYVNNDGGSTYHRRRNSHYYNTYRSTRRSTTYSTYSNSARQQSINSRRSSGGGTSSGK